MNGLDLLIEEVFALVAIHLALNLTLNLLFNLNLVDQFAHASQNLFDTLNEIGFFQELLALLSADIKIVACQIKGLFKRVLVFQKRDEIFGQCGINLREVIKRGHQGLQPRFFFEGLLRTARHHGFYHGADVGLAEIKPLHFHAIKRIDQKFDRAVLQSDALQNTGDHTDFIQIFCLRIINVGFFLSQNHNLVAVAHGLNSRKAHRAAGVNRLDAPRENHHIAKRKNRQNSLFLSRFRCH